MTWKEDEPDAKHMAEQALQWLDDDARWGVLRDKLEAYIQLQRDFELRMMELEYIREMVLGSDTLRKDWRDVLAGRITVDKFLHDHRLSKEAGIPIGARRKDQRKVIKLNVDDPPDDA